MRYDDASAWCREVVSGGHVMLFDPDMFHSELTKASKQFDIPYESLHSFLRNVHLIHIKRTHHWVRSQLFVEQPHYLQAYTTTGTSTTATTATQEGDTRRSILEMARHLNHPPYMMARLVVEHMVCNTTTTTTTGPSKKFVTEAMRDPMNKLGTLEAIDPQYHSSQSFPSNTTKQPSVVKVDAFSGRPVPLPSQPVTRLATEVMEAIDSDPMYGPRQDRERHFVGLEHELMLEQSLRAMGIPFETETELRIRGTPRTPDILFSCPVGIRVPKRNENTFEWKVVCWIDSKALFGDVHTHRTSVLPQAETYVHRFGPGLVLYWFGHAPIERLGDGHGDVVIAGWNVPTCFMLPTGELASHGTTNSTVSFDG
eukprot:CAMPEP_0198290534 /NCGR_PEP_ID=MMETSP1449-20131203/8359_1 /TAXON_ID=420275 /ORGANISM="Attheya septentrionalis, Strain CCMP2084" /LENGTH=368 /DNA_ID=CAMNT_0043989043 /DNA_START=158 /DNA_END=1264 /DNA_ORIENTATION=-